MSFICLSWFDYTNKTMKIGIKPNKNDSQYSNCAHKFATEPQNGKVDIQVHD
jgi:hypothetical protein